MVADKANGEHIMVSAEFPMSQRESVPQREYINMLEDRITRHIPEIIELLKPLDPEKVIVFGSEASGSATEASDLDLMVVTKSDELPASHKQREEVYLSVARLLRTVKRRVPVDLIVHTHAMHVRFIELDSQFAREVLQKGVVVYESDHA